MQILGYIEVFMSGDNKKIDPAVLAAIITVVGGIIITLITTLANRPARQLPTATPPPTWTNVPTATITDTPVPTSTVPAGEPTSTPAPDTATPAPTFTPTPPPIGADWVNNCISAMWKPFPDIPVEQKDGCLVPLVDKFYTTNGHLAFAYSDRVSSAQIFGLFAQLPSDGTASLKVHLTDITKGEILIGIFSAPDPSSNGMLLVLPFGKDLQEQRMLVRTMPDKKTFAQTDGPVISSTQMYDMSFDFNGGNVNVKLKNNQINLGTVPVISTDKWLFIGYQVLNGTNNLQADFFDLAVQKR